MELGILDLLIQFIIILFAIVVSSLVTIPFVGVIVRFRANYNPKGLRLDAEGDATPHTGPIVRSLTAMFLRVRDLEGWSGLYKGFMPNVISTSVVLLIATIMVGPVVGNGSGAHSKYAAPVDGPLNRLIFSGIMIAVSLPVAIISNRAITTPYKLPWFNAPYALRILLTRAERRRPWLLYLTPGLFLSEITRAVYVFLVWDPLSSLIIPPSRNSAKPFENVTLARTSLLLGLVFISTIVVNPLEVISTRLSIQRNHARTGMESEAEDDDTLLENATFAGSEEDVIGLRSEDDPYTGFVDCARRMANEEGYGTLLRAWWLIAFSMFFTGLAK